MAVANGRVKANGQRAYAARSAITPWPLALSHVLVRLEAGFARHTTRRPLTNRTRNSTMAMTSNT